MILVDVGPEAGRRPALVAVKAVFAAGRSGADRGSESDSFPFLSPGCYLPHCSNGAVSLESHSL
jgi:hypothetical protein